MTAPRVALATFAAFTYWRFLALSRRRGGEIARF
jgi:hypothetical protein